MTVWQATFWTFLALLGVAVPLTQLGGKSKTVRALSTFLLLLGTLAGLSVASRCLWQGIPVNIELPSVASFPVSLTIDRLSALFFFLICSVSLPVVIFSTSYIAHHYEAGRARWMWALLSLFVLSMAVVVTSSTGFAFLVGWELMTLVSSGLILIEGDAKDRIDNVFIYLLMMHGGAAAVVASFFLYWPSAHGLEFTSIRSASANLSAGVRTAIFLLTFVGFGTKAGIIPFHLWLPRAHPIAPSPVSALMSGVMLKTAVYAFVRFGFDFLGGGPSWWGYLVLTAGAVSGLLGILFALQENDLKRMLAYSSIENVGIIYLGLGTALLFLAHGSPKWAALALVAALLHSLNHAFFKSLLFLGAGAISDGSHRLSQDELGGLQKRMPMTGVAILIGCCSIAGLPLFNGFVGEWLLFRSFLAGPNLASAQAQVVLPLLVGVLALIGGLSLACFVKAYGVVFLGRPRTEQAENAREVSWSMRGALIALAAICLGVGLFPAVLLAPVSHLANRLVGGFPPTEEMQFFAVMPWMGAVILVIGSLTLLASHRKRVTATWGCGLPSLTSRMQYTATTFSKPLRMVFARVYKADRKIEILPEDQPYSPESVSYRSVRTTSFERAFYRPAVERVVGLAHWLRLMQTGNIQVYLLYIFLTLVALLVFLRFQR
ncbi:MAG: hydrogenase 4 subunit B [Acidobacteria bacterium]|nr:hydrogenase 4 subunit B [Acidobacteriota bacterium]MCL5287933.1 hydrogenase 4 subunit B [Acidobacteriota bacterium]